MSEKRRARIKPSLMTDKSYIEWRPGDIDPDEAKSRIAELERLEAMYRDLFTHALKCVDRVFQEGGQPEPPILPDFGRPGDDKFEAVVRLAKAYAELEAENSRLRAALAVSKDPCVYCSLPAEEMAKCQHGFPGCDRADDMMGCLELGASLERDALKAENARLRECMSDLVKCIHENPLLVHAAIDKARDLLAKGGE